MTMNVDKLLHQLRPVLPYNPLKFVIHFMEHFGQPLFGFDIEIQIQDLDLYELDKSRTLKSFFP